MNGEPPVADGAGAGPGAVRNAVSGGTFHGPVTQAHSIGKLVYASPPPPMVVPGSPPPRTLPGVTAHFTNRTRELAAVADALRDPRGAPTVVMLVGPGGVGKTAMALKLAASLRDRFPDGELHGDLRGGSAAVAATPSTVLCRFLHALGVHPEYVPAQQTAQADLFRSLVAGRRVLVLLDDVHSAAQVRPLVTGSEGSLTLITSRRELPGVVVEFGARVLRVGPLEQQDAVQLLSRVAGEGTARTRSRDAEAVARRCAGLPLALCTAAARMAVSPELSWATLEREMTDGPDGEAPAHDGTPVNQHEHEHEHEHQHQDEHEHGDGGDGGSRAASAARHGVLASYAGLSPGAARLLRLLAQRAWPSVSVGAAVATAGEDGERVRRDLAELVAARLLEETGEQRFRLHDLVRTQVGPWAVRDDGLAGVAASLRRTVDWYLRTAVAADRRVTPGRWHLGPVYEALDGTPGGAPGEPLPGAGAGAGDDAEPAGTDAMDAAGALDLLSGERENLTEAVQAAADCGFDELVWQLCEALWSLFLRRGCHQDWVRTHRLGVAAAVRCADRRAEGRMRCQLAFAHLGLGRHAEAETEFLAALEADRLAGHQRGRATAVESLGLLRLRQDRPEEAGRCFEEARVLAEAVGDPRALALLQHHLGRALRGQGRYGEAVGQLNRAREAMRELPDRYNEGRVLTSLGETLLEQDRSREAAEALADAAGIMAGEGAVIQQAHIASLRAQCARATGEASAERRHLEDALAYHRATGSPEVEQVASRLARLTAAGEE